MRVNYNGLWKILIDNNMKKTDLQEIANIAPATIAKMGKGEFVSMETLFAKHLMLILEILYQFVKYFCFYMSHSKYIT